MSNQPSAAPLLRIAVPVPLSRSFDYLPPAGLEAADCPPGARIEVPFGRGSKLGVVLEQATESDLPRGKLRRARRLLDDSALLPADILDLLRWASHYYHHPIGEVLETALPLALRQIDEPRRNTRRHYLLSAAGRQLPPGEPRRAPLQARLLERLRDAGGEADSEQLATLGGDWRGAAKRLLASGLIELQERAAGCAIRGRASQPAPDLNAEQQQAVAAIRGAEGFASFLLDGVTGSGKTEVYLQAIGGLLDAGRQVLVLVPEIGLTPQLVARFSARLAAPMATLHSAMAAGERLLAWQQCADGRARVLIGTRSAVFAPLPELGGIFVDEEHDGSFKQQDGFRYHARDLALLRARNAGVPIVLGSATPSLESLHNALRGRHRLLQLRQRAGGARAAPIRLVDLRQRSPQEGLSDTLISEARRHLDAGGQVLFFLNRRGYAPTLLCDACGGAADCRRCDAHMTVHAASGRLRCHHCGAQRPLPRFCDHCGGRELVMLGQGTERIEAALAGHFPDYRLLRIDRDSTRRKGALEAGLEAARSGRAQVLIGTQMLAKGHHFPGVTLVGMLDADRGLFGADFRATEQMAQLILQVAGRAGRAERPGEVLVQTRNPDHPLLQLLVREGYRAFAEAELDLRGRAQLPPHSHLALIRAESPQSGAPLAALGEVRDLLASRAAPGLDILGPAVAPMERLAGRFRAQLLLQAAQRADLQRVLGWLRPAMEGMAQLRRVRWSLDVDPVDLL